MYQKYYLSSERGLTLVETLVSIVLLFIVLTSFMGFFTQSALFQKLNEEKLSVSQTSQKIVNLVEINSDINMIKSTFMVPEYEIPAEGLYRLTNMDDTQKANLKALIGDEVNSIYHITLDFQEFEQEEIYFIEVTVKVSEPTNPVSESVTYTFIKE